MTRGYISGTVQDATGAVIAGAKVKITNVDTQIARETATNDAGVYRFVAVEPGTYVAEFSKGGFDIQKVGGILVGTNQEVTLNQELKIGTAASAVEVTEAPPGVELAKSTATIERTLSRQMVSDLPVFANGNQDRDVTRLALLAPTVNRGPGSTGLSANGQRARNNNFTIDGVDNNDADVSLANSRIIPEAVAEFQVQTSSYSAEFGHSSGAQISVITRSGGNAFHGEAYDYYNGNWMQPVNLLNKRAGFDHTPRFDQNEAGGDVGGHIVKDRTFFYALVETNRFRQAPDSRNASPVVIPTATGYSALSQIPLGPDQSAQSRQAALKALNFFPGLYSSGLQFANLSTQTVDGVPVQVGTATIPLANPFDYWYYQGRLDHRLTNNDSLTYRLQIDKRSQPDVTSNLGFGARFSAAQAILAQNHALSETHTFGPRVVNEFRFAFARRNLAFPENDPIDPTVIVAGAFTLGGLNNFPQGRVQNTFQWQDIATATMGRHSLKFGADIRRLRLFNVSDFDSKGTFRFNGLADFLNNQANQIVQAVNTATFDARQTSQYYFVQDDFKATKNLTLNLGLRYERSNVPFGFYGAANAQVAAVGVPANVKPDNDNWAPRVGFAWSPSPSGGWMKKLLGDGQTVFRGGFGMGYDILFYNILVVNASNYPRVVVNQLNFPDANNVYPAQLPRSATVPALNPLATFVNSPTDTQNPTTEFYSFSIQRQLRNNYVLELGYTGNRSYHQIRQGDTNPGVLTSAQAQAVLSAGAANVIPSLQARRVNPSWGDRVTIETTALSNYNALYLKVDKRLSHGLTIGGSYTFSKLMSDNDESLGVAAITGSSPQVPQNYFNYRPEYSRSVFDRPQRLVWYYTYQLPWFRDGMLANSVMKGVFSGWEMSGFTEYQSGQPFTIITGVDTGGNGSAAQRPTYNPNGSFTKDPVTGNLRTFTIPLNGTGIVVTPLNASGRPLIDTVPNGGNLGRNTFRGPGLASWNVSLAKTFSVTERIKLLIRADWTDLFNYRNFSNPSSNINSPLFGTNTSDPGTRSGFLAAKVSF